jgi:hypothetical protein
MEARRPLMWWGLWIGLSVLWAAAFFAPKVGMPCYFKLATGVGCPGCGLTRSVYALCQGRPQEAIVFHLFGPVAMLLAFGFWAYYGVALLNNREPFSLGSPACVKGWIALAVCFAVYWLVRLVLGVLPS